MIQTELKKSIHQKLQKMLRDSSSERAEANGNFFIKNILLKRHITSNDDQGFAIMAIPVIKLEFATKMKIQDILAMNEEGLSITLNPKINIVNIVRNRLY